MVRNPEGLTPSRSRGPTPVASSRATDRTGGEGVVEFRHRENLRMAEEQLLEPAFVNGRIRDADLAVLHRISRCRRIEVAERADE